MDKAYYLPTCDTCRKILKSLPEKANLVLQDIRTEPITGEQLHEMRRLAGSYEALFSRRAQRYKSEKLNEQKLEEDDFRRLILEHYTFLSRPVFIIGGKIYIGNSVKNVSAVIEALS